MPVSFTDKDDASVTPNVDTTAPLAPPASTPAPTPTPVSAPVATPVVASILPKGFSGRIHRTVIVGDTSVKGNNSGVTFHPGDEEKLARHLVRLREAQPHDYSELVRMKVISGDWKLQFIKL